MIFQTIDQRERKRRGRIKLLTITAFIVIGLVSWMLVRGVKAKNHPIRDFHFRYAHARLR